VRDVSHLEPAAVFSIATWDNAAPSREMDIEISRWGESAGKNAQYVIQPYYLPANSVRFTVPAGTLTHSLLWEPGRASFRTVRGDGSASSEIVAGHAFTSGVKPPENAMIRMNLYVFGKQNESTQESSRGGN
jgi:hypothetical protein